MGRRIFLMILMPIFAFLGGCFRRKEREEERREERREERAWGAYTQPTPIDPVDRVGRRIQHHLAGDGYCFDPITISILSMVVCAVFRYCVQQTALRIQQQVQRRPNGTAAVRLRGKLHAHFSEIKSDEGYPLFNNNEDVKEHVNATMAAFAAASADELKELWVDVRRRDQPTVDMAVFRAAGEWSRCDEEY